MSDYLFGQGGRVLWTHGHEVDNAGRDASLAIAHDCLNAVVSVHQHTSLNASMTSSCTRGENSEGLITTEFPKIAGIATPRKVKETGPFQGITEYLQLKG